MKKGNILVSVGMVLFLSAIFLTFYNFYESYAARKQADSVVSVLTESIRSNPDKEKLPGYEKYPDMEMPTVAVDGERYVGYIEIPGLDIRLPVAQKCDLTQLKRTPCYYSGSVYLDNMVIAAHNYRSHFGSLKRLPMGSEVIFTDAAENVFKFTIEWLETVEENDKEGMITADDWDLTLFTCTYGGEKRYAFRCIKSDN